MNIFRLDCEILSPIHIGTGSAIDPMQYVIDDSILYVISFDDFVMGLSSDKRGLFEKYLDTNNFLKLRSFVVKHFRSDIDCLYSATVVPEIDLLYQEKLKDIQNQLFINPFIRTGLGHRPYIPGSSFKGAIRTAILNSLAHERKVKGPRDVREEYSFESRTIRYRDAKGDPFRALKICDSMLEEKNITVSEVKNVARIHRNDLQKKSIQMVCEICDATLKGTPVEFQTKFTIDDTVYLSSFLSFKFSKNQIIRCCNDFYRLKMEDEHKKFFRGTDVEEFSAKLLKTPLNDDSFLLRIGRFSGVESVTLDTYRNPRPPGRKRVWGTTRNLAQGKYPMGWVKATFVKP